MGRCRGIDSIPGLAQWVKGSGVAAAVAQVTAVAQIQSLPRELPCTVGVAIKKKKVKMVSFICISQLKIKEKTFYSTFLLVILWFSLVPCNKTP